MANKEYTIYYTEPGLARIQRPDFYDHNDPENNRHIPPEHPIDPGSHGHEIQPSNDNHMIHHNNTIIEHYDISYFVINLAFNLLFCLLFFEVFKRCYLRFIMYNQNRNTRQRLIIEEEVEYPHNRVVIRNNVKEEVCSICLEELFPEDIENSNQVIELKCSHMFHKDCIDPWIKTNKNCPLCKNNV